MKLESGEGDTWKRKVQKYGYHKNRNKKRTTLTDEK